MLKKKSFWIILFVIIIIAGGGYYYYYGLRDYARALDEFYFAQRKESSNALVCINNPT